VRFENLLKTVPPVGAGNKKSTVYGELTGPAMVAEQAAKAETSLLGYTDRWV
jgi:hypothetical protein